MAHQLERAVVRIFWRGEQRVCGAGFLVTPRHILTCAHVVFSVLGRNWEKLPRETTLPEEHLQVDFPNLSDEPTRLTAKVLVWSPTDNTDVAVLELITPAPREARPAPMKIIHNVAQHPYTAYGFNYDRGRWSSGKILNAIASHNVQLNSDADAWQPITQGFSGTAIWDEREGCVVGMVVEVDTVETRIAHMIPVSKLCTIWPTLKTLLPAIQAPPTPLPRLPILPRRAEERWELRTIKEIQGRRYFLTACIQDRSSGSDGLVERLYQTAP